MLRKGPILLYETASISIAAVYWLDLSMQGIFIILSILVKPQTDSSLNKKNKIYILNTDIDLYTKNYDLYTRVQTKIQKRRK